MTVPVLLRNTILALATALVLAPAAHAGMAPDAALSVANDWRAKAGLPPLTSMDAAWNEGCRLHNAYLSNGSGGGWHSEDPARPDYTEAGASAGGASVLAGGESGPLTWEDAVFHRTSVLQPRLRVSGFDASSGHTCMRVFGGIDDSAAARTAQLTLYPWPHAGQRDVAPYGIGPGSETPDPYDAMPGVDQAGYLVSVSVNGPWPHSFDPVPTVTGATLTPDGGAPVALTVLDGDDELGGYLDGGFALFPHAELVKSTWYTAHVTGTVRAARVDHPFDLTWRFQTERTDPGTSVEMERGVVRVRSANPSSVHVRIIHQATGGVRFDRTLAPGASERLALAPGHYALCYSQTGGERFRDVEVGCGRDDADEFDVAGVTRLKLSAGRRSGGRIRFALTASASLTGRAAGVRTYRQARKCGRVVNPSTGRRETQCWLAWRRIAARTITLRAAQSVTAPRPRKGRAVRVTVGTHSFRAGDAAFPAAQAQRTAC